METFEWSPEMSLGIVAMDQAHKDFVEELVLLGDASDQELGPKLDIFIPKIELDFRVEEELMEEINFAGIQGHREQHARVLSALHHVESDVMAGNYGSAREAIVLLPQWPMFHLSTMDFALAAELHLLGWATDPSPVEITQEEQLRANETAVLELKI